MGTATDCVNHGARLVGAPASPSRSSDCAAHRISNRKTSVIRGSVIRGSASAMSHSKRVDMPEPGAISASLLGNPLGNFDDICRAVVAPVDPEKGGGASRALPSLRAAVDVMPGGESEFFSVTLPCIKRHALALDDNFNLSNHPTGVDTAHH